MTLPVNTAATGNGPTWLFRATRIIVLVALAISVLVCVLHEKPARALIAANGWETTTGFFQNVRPQADELRESVLQSKDVTYWRSWTSENLAAPGEIRSAAFKAPRFLLVPHSGFAGDSGISLNLECVASRRQLAVATARVGNQWSEALLYVPKRWCKGPVQLVGTSTSHTQFLSVGTPFSVSATSYLKAGILGLLAPFALAFAIVAGVMLAGGALLRRISPTSDPVAGGFLGFGILGMGLFFLFFFSAPYGALVSGVVSIAALLSLRHVHRRARHEGRAPGALVQSWDAWKLPLALWLLAATFLLFLAATVQNGAGPWAMNARFTPVRWSTDNQLPMIVAEYLFNGKDLNPSPFGAWKVSDRPPLSYGLLAMLRTSAQIFFFREDGLYMTAALQQMFGMILNTVWIPAVVVAGRKLRLTTKQIVTLVALVTLTSFAIFNSLYTWPKLLGGAFGLLALLTVMQTDAQLSLVRSRPSAAAIAICAALSAFALLSHGGTAFGVIAMLLWLVCVRGIPRIPGLIAGAVVGIGILAPWSLWQQMVQPPGNALVKFAFAGTFGFGEDDIGLLDTIMRTYSKLDLASWWHIKWVGFETLMFGRMSMCGFGEMATPVLSGYGALRITDFLYLLPSFRFALAGALPLLGAVFVPRLLGAADRAIRQWRVAAGLFAIGAMAVAIDLALTLDCFIIHHQAYQSILEMYIGLFTALLLWRHWLAKVALVGSAVYGCVVWIIEPVVRATHVSTLALAGLFVMAALCWSLRTRLDAMDEPPPVGGTR
ncbi:hypothetical protein [Luteibacter sp. dw_328]|uniref:hypothetical protein n=1 Tax=Luteibacter sp. dw_328 TaxID=2719796 RepID=UPI001BD6B811|nr:hypothetical protein [Luteibacter sp. dw_328]